MKFQPLPILCSIFCLCICAADSRRRGRKSFRGFYGRQSPNIVLFITDDQDVELGSMEFMPKTLRIFRQRGVEFKRGIVTTPICCPSRSSLFTGRYVHNHGVFSNKVNCSSEFWQRHHEPNSFGPLVKSGGYRTGYFGKYLNEYDGTYVPTGWDSWMGLIKNSRFYNYSINFNGRKIKHGNSYHKDYLTDLIGNDSIRFLHLSKQRFPQRPLLMVLSFPAPHGPEDPAPQYSTHFPNITTHRTQGWNYAPNPDKEWLMRHTGKMEPVHVAFTDLLHRRRLQTLQSVDDVVFRVVNELRSLRQLSNTYLFFTSDHGYHLGQFGLLKGKNLPYEFDIKVPFFVRGPRVPRGIQMNELVANIDLTPTFLDIAGVKAPDIMDGTSLLPLLHQKPVNWRHTILLERGKMIKLRKVRERFFKQRDHYSKELRIQKECQKNKYSAPCKPLQQWECRKNDVGRWRIFKCRGAITLEKECACASTDFRLRSKRSTETKIFKKFESKYLFEWERSDAETPGLVPEAVTEAWESQFFNQLIQEEVTADGEWFQGIFDAVEILDTTPEMETDIVQGFFEENQRSIPQQLHSRVKREKIAFRGRIRDKGTSRKNRIGLRKKLRKLKNALLHSGSRNGKRELCDCVNKWEFETESKKAHPLKLPFKGYVSDGELLSLARDRRSRRKERRGGRGGGRRRKKGRGRKSEKKLYCNVPAMNCFIHDPYHWATPPLWPQALGSFCFCQNANNNSYWCLRTANSTHNFLYCEFITGFVSYYDINADPHQLHNAVYQLPVTVLESLSEQLQKLKNCSGKEDCERHSRPNWSPTQN